MKLFLLLSTLWTYQASAQTPVCTTDYIVETYSACPHSSHGVDMSKPVSQEPILEDVESDWLPGGQDQQLVCATVAAHYNFRYGASGSSAVLHLLNPIGEKGRTVDIRRREYKYTCRLAVYRRPYKIIASPACGFSGKWFISGGHAPGNIMVVPYGQATCLACDSERNNSESLVACLSKNISKLLEVSVEYDRVTRRDRERLVMVVNELKTVNKFNRIRNLQTTDQILPFQRLLDRYQGQ